MVDLAKPALDVGLYTNDREAMLAFWQDVVGVGFEGLLPVGRGVHQLRHRIGDSVLKINHARAPLPPATAAGYRKLRIARSDVSTPRTMTDPDGNHVSLVPSGHDGILQLELEVAVRDVTAQADFYGRVLGLEAVEHSRFRCGSSLLSIVQDADATIDPPMQAPGFRYVTLQVFDVITEHTGILARGGREGSAPVRLGDVAYISFVRDPGGNWIEISQRKSLTGSLDSPSAARYT
jgi:lactoylglutathione lyase